MKTVFQTAVCFALATLTVLSSLTAEASAAEISEKNSKRVWGTIVTDGRSLELRVSSIPKSRKLDIPRLNNRLDVAYLKSDTKKSPLTLHPLIETWEIQLPPDMEEADKADVIVEFKEPVSIGHEIAIQAKDGTIALPAHIARTHGKLLRYEPQPHKNTVGYWANAEDWAEWSLQVDLSGGFEVEVHQGCGKGQGGSTVEFELILKGEKSGPKLTHTIVDTGHFQNFKPFKLGKFEDVKTGEYALKVRCLKKAKNAVCDIRLIQLLPAK